MGKNWKLGAASHAMDEASCGALSDGSTGEHEQVRETPAAGLPSCKAEATPLSSTITLDVSLILQTDSISTIVTFWGLGQHIVVVDKIRGVDTCIFVSLCQEQ
jgi:hypothetical protein